MPHDVGGFSQGGAISLFTGVTSSEKLAGIFGLSSYLLLHDKIKDYVTTESSNKSTPVFMGHGDVDPLVRHDWGSETAKALRELGWTVDFRTYKGGVCSLFSILRCCHRGRSRNLELYIVILKYRSKPHTDIAETVTGKLTIRYATGLAHSADPKEIDDLEKYLSERLPPQEK